MNQQAEQHLSRAAEYLKIGHKRAAQEIIAAMKADPQMSFTDIGQFFGKSEKWARVLVQWYDAGAEGPIDWKRGSHTKENEEAIGKFLATASAEDIENKIGKARMVKLVAEADPDVVAKAVAKKPELATAITQNEDAKDNINDAIVEGIRTRTGYPNYTGNYSGNQRSLSMKIQSFGTKAHQLAVTIAGTWKDDAPLASERDLMFARDKVAGIIIDFEETISKALRETKTQEVDRA